MRERCKELGILDMHVGKLYNGLVFRNCPTVADVPNLPKKLYELADREFTLCTSKLISQSTSSDGSATKVSVVGAHWTAPLQLHRALRAHSDAC